MTIVIATSNRYKFNELVDLLALPGIEWRSLSDFPDTTPAEESGLTYAANAIRKARAVSIATGLLALADDSGIEVDVLGGKPGIHSARFAGEHGDDAANNAKMLKSLRALKPIRRTARYRCVLALCDGKKVLAVTEGVWEGRIAEEPKGTGGFGYDPLFYLPTRKKTAGQISPALKQRISHRSQAALRMKAHLRRLTATVQKSSQKPPAKRRPRKEPAT